MSRRGLETEVEPDGYVFVELEVTFMVFPLCHTVVEAGIEEEFRAEILVEPHVDGVFPFHLQVLVIVEGVEAVIPTDSAAEVHVSVDGYRGTKFRFRVLSCIDSEACDDV